MSGASVKSLGIVAGGGELPQALADRCKEQGIHILPELLAEEGALSRLEPTSQQRADIALGIEESQKLGAADLGQSVIVHDGSVIGREDASGTDALIREASTNMRGGILVKTCKPQQDRDLDMPTIGPRTIQAAHENGLSGIAVQASETLIADRAETIKLADQYGLFLIGVSL